MLTLTHPNFDHFIGSVTATADHIAAKKGSTKRIGISFDEWNVWYQSRHRETGNPADWQVAPRVIEDAYNVADAVVVGNLLISLLRNSDRVAVACQAQLANVIAPIRSEPGGPAWRQTIFHPFALTSRLATGEVLQVQTTSASVGTERFGDVDAVATYDDAGELTLFLVNRSVDETVRVEVDARGVVPARGGGVVDRARRRRASDQHRAAARPGDTVRPPMSSWPTARSR